MPARVERVKKPCSNCGKIREYRPCEVRRYCSVKCAHAPRIGSGTTPRTTKPCEYCGKPFNDYTARIGKFCSRPCVDLAKVQPVNERFWSQVALPDANGCRLWTGWVSRSGYGRFTTVKKRKIHAHRYALMCRVGPMDDSIFACHNCPGGDIKLCCEPTHLFPGTPADNIHDALAKGQMAVGDRHWTHVHPERKPTGDRHWTQMHPDRIRFGDAHHRSKVTDAQVREIRTRRAAGEIYRVIAMDYGITPSQCCAIANRRSRANVP